MMNIPEKPVTRKEMYYAHLASRDASYPKPITREEQYLYYLCENGGIGGGGSCVCGGSAPAIIAAAAGGSIALTDSVEAPFEDFHLYGRTTQDGTPMPENPVDLISAGDKGNVIVSVKNGADSAQSLSLSTLNGLPGIPVTSGGNYTDENGQQWICDEIDLERGKYIQRVWKKVLDGSERWTIYDVPAFAGYYASNILPIKMLRREGFCNQLKVDAVGLTVSNGIWIGVNGLEIYCINNCFYNETLGDKGLDNWKAHLAETPLEIMTYLDEPIETDIPADEIAAYKTLHTNYPTTVITNDAGAGQDVQYVADTKNYIDNKIAALEQALANT